MKRSKIGCTEVPKPPGGARKNQKTQGLELADEAKGDYVARFVSRGLRVRREMA